MPQSHTSRREFLTATGGMVLAGCAPAILGATDKSGSKPPVIGPEGHRYEMHHDCMQIPSHIRCQDSHGVAVDAEEFLYLCDNKGYIARSTLNGEIVWKQEAPKIPPYRGARPFELKTPGEYVKGYLFSPTNTAFAPDGGFWVGDGYGSHYIIKYAQDARVVGHFGGSW